MSEPPELPPSPMVLTEGQLPIRPLFSLPIASLLPASVGRALTVLQAGAQSSLLGGLILRLKI